MGLCDRALWLDGGCVRELGPAKDVCHNYLAAILSEQEDPGRFHIGGKSVARIPRIITDPRAAELRSSELKNTVEVFDFDPDAKWFGERGGTIVDVRLADETGAELKVLEGGEVVNLCVSVKAEKELARPIVGFYVKDRRGQQLFGDNTYMSYRLNPIRVERGELIEAIFKFQLPFLPPGDFSITVALASGTQAEHVQQHWLEDGLYFHVATSHVHRGLVGIPMMDIQLKKGAGKTEMAGS